MDDTRDELRGRLLNELFDARAHDPTSAENKLATEDTELGRELKQYAGLLREFGLAKGDFEAFVRHGVLERSEDPQYAATLGPYQIVEYLGRGGMGVVFKAYEASLRRVVALKILRPELSDDKNAIARFTREARAAAALHHPNIVAIHAVGEHNHVHYIAMEYIAGPSLASVIRDNGALTTEETRDLFRQLLRALGTAHEAGLIHRDIKSSNILLESGGDNHLSEENSPNSAIRIPNSVKLADFGLARMLTAQTRVTLDKAVLGTPEYMSPEQTRGDEDLDQRADLYSAGVVLYEMLTGRTPFKANTPTAVMHQILNIAPSDPKMFKKDIDPNLASLALRLMAKQPIDRFESASAVLDILDADRPVKSRSRQRRLRAYAWTGAAILILLVVIGRLWATLTAPPGEIIAARVDPNNPLRIQVSSDEERWTEFRRYPDEIQAVSSVTMADPDGQGSHIIVVGFRRPYRDHNIIAYGLDGSLVWETYLKDESGRTWPDCAPPALFSCVHVRAAQLDDQPGDELVAVFTDFYSYPSCVAVMDPRSHTIRSSFWHMGNIDKLLIVREFFDGVRPAIVVWGLNNKLDGFDDGTYADPRFRSHWEYVRCLVILDPLDMDGLGPPRVDRPELSDLRPARPYAYAFLDMPYRESMPYVPSPGQPQERQLSRNDLGAIHMVSRPVRKSTDETGPWLDVNISTETRAGVEINRALLTVNRHLEIVFVDPFDMEGETVGTTKQYWDQFWHCIIKEGEYIE